MPALGSDRVYVVDVKTDPRKPRLDKVMLMLMLKLMLVLMLKLMLMLMLVPVLMRKLVLPSTILLLVILSQISTYQFTGYRALGASRPRSWDPSYNSLPC